MIHLQPNFDKIKTLPLIFIQITFATSIISDLTSYIYVQIEFDLILLVMWQFCQKVLEALLTLDLRKKHITRLYDMLEMGLGIYYSSR